MNQETKELAAIAAAVAGKCQPCFAHHYRQARALGIASAWIEEVIQLAKDIRGSADNHMDAFVERRMREGSGEARTDDNGTGR